MRIWQRSKLLAATAVLMTAAVVTFTNAKAAAPSSGSNSAPGATDQTPAVSPTPPQVTNQPASADHPSSASSSLGAATADIVKMSKAGVSLEVIKAYIAAVPATLLANVSAADLIALKEQGIPDDVTTALLKRAGELQAQPSAAAASPSQSAPEPARQTVVLPSLYGGLDPEGYDYFRYYYLHPRTLASVYQRLGPYGYGFGYYSPGFPGPYLSSGFGGFPRYGSFGPAYRGGGFAPGPRFGR